MYSAVKVGGQKLYDLARKGQVVERKPRRITIYELELLAQESATDYLLRCRCSKGTYIRTLCHDIGRQLGCGGTLYASAAPWRRLQVGPGSDAWRQSRHKVQRSCCLRTASSQSTRPCL